MRNRGGNISLKYKTFITSVLIVFFISLGAVYASDVDNVTMDNSNLIQDDSMLSSYNLEVSSNNSISENNLIDSHNDNLIENSSSSSESYEENVNNDDPVYVDEDYHIDVEDAQNTQIISEDTNSTNNDSNSTNQTYFDSDNVIMYYKNGTQWIITLYDSNGNPLANQNISFIINGGIYNRVTDEFGNAYLNINLNPGNYSITSIYNGTGLYAGTNVTNNITVLPTISGSDVVKYYKNGTQYYAVALDGNGNPLVGVNVTFNINGVMYTRVTNEEGIAMLSINLNPGNYIITAIHPNGLMISNNITVLPTISGSDVVKYYKNGTQYYAVALDGNGNPLVGVNVTFNINGVMYTRVTNEEGIAMLSINLNPGNYIITAIHPDGMMISNNITVLSTVVGEDIIKEFINGTQYQVTVVDGNGNPLVGVNVTFNINGVFYNRVTDENGIAKLNINLNPGNYIITAIHPNGQMISNNIVVIPANVVITSNTTVLVGNDKKYTVTLKTVDGSPVSSAEVYFYINNNRYVVVTNELGEATLDLSSLPLGEYVIEIVFAGDFRFNSANASSNLLLINSTTILDGEDIVIEYQDGSTFDVYLTDINGNPLVGETVVFQINGVTYKVVTDANGKASFDCRNLTPGTHNITYSYSTKGQPDYNNLSSTITVTKQTVDISGEDIVLLPGDGSYFEVLVTSKDGTPLSNVAVDIIVNGVTYSRYTDENGIARLKINLGVGYYDVYYTVNDDLYSSNNGSNKILVNGSIMTSNETSVNFGSDSYFTVKITDAYGRPIVGATIRFVISTGETLYAVTDGNGIARISLSDLPIGDYYISYFYDVENAFKQSGMNSVHVVGSISIDDMISAAETVKEYIENNHVLPETVVVGSFTYTMSEFLYLLAVATINMDQGNFDNIFAIDVNSPDSPVSSGSLGNLYDYASVAQAIVDFINQNGKAPNSINSNLGDIGYENLIYAFARVVAYYGNNGVMPNYVAIKSVSTIDVPDSPLNSQNTITDLDPYKGATTNCQVNDPAIQSLAQSLTEGITGELEKATAIYNYVRDNIKYASYWDTAYGAKGTLDRKIGNCCDQAHLLSALLRAAGFATRYVHGVCSFTSGSTYGHVWVQVLIGDTWVVADPTSSRNSLGDVNNWNNYGYTLNGYYATLPF
ncbi:Ig-like domain-containing protein [Methanobrevibacter woesei]|uniref:transglutaminase domain-containing protein n=1 Tax=Methanobrevibacter woesei TaxID=190976 RepID=UPI0023F26D78|nr:Ig-like domain-containing protein [Methanobrevibacter woesei]